MGAKRMKYVLALIITLFISTAAYAKSDSVGNWRLFCDESSCSATALYEHNKGALSVVLLYAKDGTPVISVFYGSENFRVDKNKAYHVSIHVNGDTSVVTSMKCSAGSVIQFQGFFCQELLSFDALMGLRMWKSIGINGGTKELQAWYGLKGSARAIDRLVDLFSELTPPTQGIEG